MRVMAAMAVATLVLSLVALRSPTWADPSPEDWRYLARVGVLTKVNEALWHSLEDQGAWDPELARYARKANAMNLAELRRWGAPRREFLNFHNDLSEILETLDQFYAAIAASDYPRAHANGTRIENQMKSLEESWQTLAASLQ